MNRLQKEKVILAELLLKDGISTRKVAKAVGCNASTARKIRRRIGKIGRGPSNNKYVRYRPEYLRKWAALQPLSPYWREHRNNIIRAFIGETLARADRPLTKREVFLCCTFPFPHLKSCSVTQMLQRNMELTFKEVEGGWTYVPSFHCPKTKPNDPLEGTWRARAIWFSKHGLKDEVVDEKISELIEQNQEHIECVHARAVSNSAGFLSLTNAAQQLTKHLNETKNHPQE